MEIENKQQEPIIRAGNETFGLNESQTGKFGITKAEFKMLIKIILSDTSNKSLPQKTLLRLFMRKLGMRLYIKNEQEYIKEFLIHLREMKEEGTVEFKSGKTKLNVRLC